MYKYEQAFKLLWGEPAAKKVGLPETNYLCPFHQDHKPSMGANLETGAYHCWSCGAKGHIAGIAKENGYKIDDFGNIERIEKKEKEPKPEVKPGTATKIIYALENYAEEKCLDETILADIFKITSQDNKITMPYYSVDGKFKYNKYRAANKKMWSDKGVDTIPYGLWLLHRLEIFNTLWIVEGESDTQTLWQNGIPAIGIPGSNAVKPNIFEDLLDFDFKQINIVSENDKAGIKFVENIHDVIQNYYDFEFMAKFYVVFPSDLGKKDINDIWCLQPNKKTFTHKISILNSVKVSLKLAYQVYVQKKKLFDKENRTIALSILPKIKAFYDVDDKLWVWNDNERQYKRIKDTALFFRTLLIKEGINKTNKISEIRSQLEVFIHNRVAPKELGKEWVILANTCVNYKTLQTKDFGFDYFITGRMPFNYNPNAKSFIIDRLFNDWVDDPVYLYEMVAYSLTRHYRGNKWFFLFGVGNNGKSTFLNIFEEMLNGEELGVFTADNTASVSLNQILMNRFSIAELYNKYLNAAGENNYNILQDTKSLKDMTGENTIQVEEKYGKPFRFRNYAKLVFATNKIPATADTTNGFYRRVIIIEFKDIPKSKVDVNLFDKITRTDMEYMLYKSVETLKSLYEKGFEFAIQKVKDMRQLYEDLSNTLKYYIRNNCIVTGSSDDWVETQDFIEQFSKWELQNNMVKMPVKDIYREMNDIGIEKDRLRVYNGSKKVVFIGIRFKTGDSEDINEIDEQSIPF